VRNRELGRIGDGLRYRMPIRLHGDERGLERRRRRAGVIAVDTRIDVP
jgi:hypothetical protein